MHGAELIPGCRSCPAHVRLASTRRSTVKVITKKGTTKFSGSFFFHCRKKNALFDLYLKVSEYRFKIILRRAASI